MRRLRWYDKGIWFRLRHALFGYHDGPVKVAIEANRLRVVRRCYLCGLVLSDKATPTASPPPWER